VSNSFRLGHDGVYRCEAFQQFVWQEHGFGTRLANPNVDVTLRQVHSDRVVNAAGLANREREGDALVANEIGKRIGVRTADCVPILLIDSHNRVVAAVHAGWRGTAADIVRRTIENMHADFDTSAADLYAAIGPCIQACCYEVGPEVARHLNATGRCKLDLPEANRRQMEVAGVAPNHIFHSGLCTACESAHFFSYRREPQNPGRMITAICRLA
jgi:purine-nucleoside/S-methyl-5'-thioadenosine phosphorylase / adenosine deaminase